MSKQIVKCQTITPIFCYGTDGETPELRAPSLKGALRFWWRAIHPNLDLKEFKKVEANIFGGASEEDNAQKSSFSIQLRNSNFASKKLNPLPHKKKSYQKSAIPTGTEFTIILREEYSNNISSLLELTSLLGGIGGRSRRGFGSFKICSIDEIPYKFEFSDDNILKLIYQINPKFEFKEYPRDYPYLQKIEIGKSDSSFDKILYNISNASHLHNSDYTGFARGKDRYASPIFVSIIQQDKKNYPIISTLKRTIADSSRNEEENKTAFIKTILGGI